MTQKSISELANDLAEATNTSVLAVIEEQKIAAHLLALSLREQHPTATVLVLRNSDQGGWLEMEKLVFANGIELDSGSIAVFDAADHIYTSTWSQTPGLSYVPDHESYADQYELDIQAVLDELAGCGCAPGCSCGPGHDHSVPNEVCRDDTHWGQQ